LDELSVFVHVVEGGGSDNDAEETDGDGPGAHDTPFPFGWEESGAGGIGEHGCNAVQREESKDKEGEHPQRRNGTLVKHIIVIEKKCVGVVWHITDFLHSSRWFQPPHRLLPCLRPKLCVSLEMTRRMSLRH